MADHVQQLKERVCEAVERRAAELIETADWIHAHPEIGHQEVEASKRLSGLLQAAGIPVEMGTAGMATAFKAELGGAARSGRGWRFWLSTTPCPGWATAVATT